VPALIKALDDTDPQVRRAAALALGYIGPDAREAAEKLKDLSKDDVSNGVRTTAGMAHGRVTRRR
jgi:HEAT repeat protein